MTTPDHHIRPCDAPQVHRRAARVSKPARPSGFAPRARRSGFTLVELVMAGAVSAILFLTMQSVILLASKAVPDAGRSPMPSDQVRALARLNADLRLAKKVTVATATSVAVQVPDRDGDNLDDTITYAWTGTSGGALTRQFNATTPETLCASVQSLALTYETWTDQRPQTYTEGAEGLLASWTSSSSAGLSNITGSNWAAEYIPVSLSASATSYKPTAVSLMAAKNGASDGTTSIEFRTAQSGLPSSTVLTSATLLESGLTSSPVWTRVNLAGCRQMSPAEPLCVVAKWLTNGTSCSLQYQGSGVPAASGNIVTTTNGGSTWTATAGRALQYQLWGTVTTPDPIQYFSRCTCVLVTLQGASPAATVSATVPMANQPEVGP